MATLETGDIGINTRWPGHVMMVYEGHRLTEKVQVVHATNSRNFHLADNMSPPDDKGRIGYLIDSPTWVFRPPWERLGPQAEMKKRELKAVSDKIRSSAHYGVYRAVRLFVGSSEFGSEALQRLVKYRERLASYRPGGKFVSTVTCAEAVILTYQLTFSTASSPFFIRKDAAHTMPNTLKDWLMTHWVTVSRGT